LKGAAENTIDRSVAANRNFDVGHCVSDYGIRRWGHAHIGIPLHGIVSRKRRSREIAVFVELKIDLSGQTVQREKMV
jgi:hypothetical protein